MTVRYRSATLGEFIEHHSYDVSRGGMFIKTPSPFPPGTLLKFEVKIAEEQRVMQGVGRVVWKRDTERATEDDPAGMGIKFIKIDDASKAVIGRLVEGRGSQHPGAFDNTPDKPARMFPEASASDVPAPEDRTVMKPASELLQEALKKTAESESEPVSGFAPVPSRVTSLSSNAPAEDDSARAQERPESDAALSSRRTSSSKRQPAESDAPAAASSRRGNRSRDEPAKSSSRSSASERSSSGAKPHSEEDEGGGRALLSIVAALVVAAGIYFVAKEGAQPAPSVGAESPTLDAASPERGSNPEAQPEQPQKSPPRDTSFGTSPSKDSDAGEAESQATASPPAATLEPQPSLAPKLTQGHVPSPASRPAPVPKASSKPAPPLEPEPQVQPASKPQPESPLQPAPPLQPASEASPAPTPTSSPSPEPTPSAQPAPAPDPTESTQ